MPSIFFMPPPYTQGFAVLKINEKANRLQKKKMKLHSRRQSQ